MPLNFKDGLLKALPDISTQEEFDKLHEKISMSIQKIYKNKGIEFHIGQSQKWINMFLKYCYSIDNEEFDNKVQFFHVPIDKKNIRTLRDEYGIQNPFGEAWSKFDKYAEYLDYQKQVREAIQKEGKYPFPLYWEFSEWGR